MGNPWMVGTIGDGPHQLDGFVNPDVFGEDRLHIEGDALQGFHGSGLWGEPHPVPGQDNFP